MYSVCARRRFARLGLWLSVSLCGAHSLLPPVAFGQASYQAQVRGFVSDATGAGVANATVTIRNTGTNLSSTAHTDGKGLYIFTALRPSVYSVKVDASGFRSAER